MTEVALHVLASLDPQHRFTDHLDANLALNTTQTAMTASRPMFEARMHMSQDVI
jgi:hypothetical protein